MRTAVVVTRSGAVFVRVRAVRRPFLVAVAAVFSAMVRLRVTHVFVSLVLVLVMRMVVSSMRSVRMTMVHTRETDSFCGPYRLSQRNCGLAIRNPGNSRRGFAMSSDAPLWLADKGIPNPGDSSICRFAAAAVIQAGTIAAEPGELVPQLCSGAA